MQTDLTDLPSCYEDEQQHCIDRYFREQSDGRLMIASDRWVRRNGILGAEFDNKIYPIRQQSIENRINGTVTELVPVVVMGEAFFRLESSGSVGVLHLIRISTINASTTNRAWHCAFVPIPYLESSDRATGSLNLESALALA